MHINEVLIVATSRGLAICERGTQGWQETRRALPETYVTSLVARDEVIIVGSKEGIHRSEDSGATWRPMHEGLSIRHIRWLAWHPEDPDRVFAGTEPAGIIISCDKGFTWELRPEVETFREKHNWYLPYSPQAGCVRGFAFHGGRGYAAVEVGGVLLSNDFGETWEMAAGSHSGDTEIHPDVHSIEVHPASANLVAAPTGGGFYLSSDGGFTWGNRYRNCYCRAVWWDSVNAEHMMLGVADGVDRNGRIEETHDGGLFWTPASGGFQIPWGNHMVERFTQVGDRLLAVLSNGDFLERFLDSETWHQILPEIGHVHAVVGFDQGE